MTHPSQSVEGFAHHSLLEVRADIWNIAAYYAEGRRSSVGLALNSKWFRMSYRIPSSRKGTLSWAQTAGS